MTDEMMVQGQRPSATPYVLGGAAVGALGGGLAANYGYGINTKVGSWEDAVNAVNKDDKFITSKIDKAEGEAKTALEKIKTEAGNVKSAKKALADALPEGCDIKDLDDFFKAQEAFETAEKAVTDKEAAEVTKVLDSWKADDFKNLPNEYELKNADGILEKKYTKDELKALFNSPDQSSKETLERMAKEQQAYRDAIAKPEFAQAEKQARTTAENAVKEAESALTKKNAKYTEAVIKDVKVANGNLKSALEKAKTELSENVLKEFKLPSKTWTAIAAGAVLAAAGYLLAPKSKDAV